MLFLRTKRATAFRVNPKVVLMMAAITPVTMSETEAAEALAQEETDEETGDAE